MSTANGGAANILRTSMDIDGRRWISVQPSKMVSMTSLEMVD
jgi:hypothetical protein